MRDTAWKTAEFEKNKRHLHAVAYRMLGSTWEADDALQEAWLRLSRADTGAVSNVTGWLTTVVARVCLDMLRARRARREHELGTWLPEPVVSIEPAGDPESDALVADSVGIALLVVLETLTPAERLSFVLHDMFAMPFEEIAPIVGRSPAATRQLASRARRRVRGATPQTDPDVREQRRVIDAFLAASRGGDFEALLEVLDPGVTLRIERGRDDGAPIRGRDAVARAVLTRGSRFAGFARPALVNGDAGVVIVPRDRPVAVVAFAVDRGRIVEIDVIANPAKLRAAAPR